MESVNIVLLMGIASLMVAVIVVLLYYVFKVTTKIGTFFLYFAFLMMAFMLIGASIYLFNPTETNLGIAVGVNMASMILLLGYFFAVAERLTDRIEFKWYHYYSLSGLVVFNEGLMGLTFGLAQFGVRSFSSPVSALDNSLNSYWFFYPMMAEMLSLYLISLSRGKNNLSLFPLIGISTFPPVIFENLLIWRYFSLVASLGFSVVGIAFKGKWRYIYVLLALGSLLSLITPWLFDVGIISGMIQYYVTSFKTERVSRPT
ncbi:hypothetical protein L3N51_01352 [Metallosphaera sp. J1]|uniref:hypothetical protein n=1 Tax=Metallosphaera javensis (ex Hofmann et al. 2022) TaxID=99938 RepID=UPI001EDDD66C|nr:hypothetical protein [Metallosphaera javensis (ex Hofmann et al. 2022)]MCG3109062.1 hypothetical protein [Metallosphaera javensis (ex Hofmann et al. 2022)]